MQSQLRCRGRGIVALPWQMVSALLGGEHASSPLDAQGFALPLLIWLPAAGVVVRDLDRRLLPEAGEHDWRQRTAEIAQRWHYFFTAMLISY